MLCVDGYIFRVFLEDVFLTHVVGNVSSRQLCIYQLCYDADVHG